MKQKVEAKYSFYHKYVKPFFKNFILFQPPWRDIIQFVILGGFFGWLIYLSTTHLEYNWQWYRMPKYLFQMEDGTLVPGRLLEGLFFTFKISGVSLILMTVIGMTTALLRLSGSFAGRWIARVYMEIIRNTPLLVQIFLLYFAIGPIIGLERFGSAVLALSLFEGAYVSEIFRAGIVSIHKGQWEAAYSLGMSRFEIYRSVVLPQAMRRIIPPLTSQVITLFKDTALVSMVALSDLTLETQIVASDTFLTFEAWFTAAAMYLVITATLSTIVSIMEKRWKVLT